MSGDTTREMRMMMLAALRADGRRVMEEAAARVFNTDNTAVGGLLADAEMFDTLPGGSPWSEDTDAGLRALGFEPVGVFDISDAVEPPCDVGPVERPDRRADRLAHARDHGQQVCPSCGYDHPATARDDRGRLLAVPCVIEADIWQAVVDTARGQGGG